MQNRSLTIVDFYKQFTVDNPELDVEYKLYRALLEDMFKLMSEDILMRSKELKMPYNLGTIQVIKYKPKNYNSKSLSVDFVNTNKYGKTIYHLNDHSNGYKYRFYWSKLVSKIKNKTKYGLVMTRANKRLLASLIKNNKKDYIEL